MASYQESQPPVKAILFDMGGVFADDMFGPMVAFMAKKASLTPEETEELKKVLKVIWNIIKVTPGPTEDFFFLEMQKKFPRVADISIAELKEVTRKGLVGHYDNVALAERIRKAEKRKLGILSNHMQEWFTEIVTRFGITPVFREHPSLVISSHEVRCAKPSHDIYAIAFTRLQAVDASIQRNQVIFVDDKDENVAAAEKFGFRGILYNAKVSPSSILAKALAERGVPEAIE